MISLEHLVKIYNPGSGSEVTAVKDVSYTFEDGIFYSIVGKSGSGKSTLLNMIGTVDTATSGDIIVNEENIFHMKTNEKALYRRRNIGFVYQSFHLLAMLTVKENIMFPFVLDHKKGYKDKDFDNNYFEEMIGILGLETMLDRRPEQLSGGQQQRVAIARAMINKPAYILADEPTGNLDSETSSQVMEFLINCVKKFYQTLILVTHDEEIAEQADVLLKMKDGKLYDRQKG